MFDDPQIQSLLEALQQPEAEVRDRATQTLWELWFEQKGIYGYQLLMRSQVMIEAGNLVQAEEFLSSIILEQPDFAEAWNRRAILYYMQKRYRKAVADCQAVIQRVPYHFGALHGLGLSYLALGEYKNAIAAFHQVVEIQPYGLENQRLILECMAKLS